MFAGLNVNTASAPGLIERSETRGTTTTARLRFVAVRRMSSTHHPPVFGMIEEDALKRMRRVVGVGPRYGVRFTLTVCHGSPFPWKKATLCHGPAPAITSTDALSVSLTVGVSVRERSYDW